MSSKTFSYALSPLFDHPFISIGAAYGRIYIYICISYHIYIYIYTYDYICMSYHIYIYYYCYYYCCYYIYIYICHISLYIFTSIHGFTAFHPRITGHGPSARAAFSDRDLWLHQCSAGPKWASAKRERHGQRGVAQPSEILNGYLKKKKVQTRCSLAVIRCVPKKQALKNIDEV